MTSGDVRLMLVTDRRRLSDDDLVTRVAAAARAGVDCIQVREKDLPGGPLRDLVTRVVAVVSGTRTRVWVNGRPDVSAAAGAHGVQLPEEGLPISRVKERFPGLAVSASRHSVEGARAAADEGADAVVLGPIFPTPGKEDRALGLQVLSVACRAVDIPVYAIGGIDLANARLAADAGAAGLALVRPFLHGPVEDMVSGLRSALTTR